MSVQEWFDTFHQNLLIPADKAAVIQARCKKITLQLNTEIWKWPSETLRMHCIGSYGRGTAIEVDDIDLFYEVPDAFYQNNRLWPRTYDVEELLTRVKAVIETVYRPCHLHKDRESLHLTFADGVRFLIVIGGSTGDFHPGFRMFTPKSKPGYREVRPLQEIQRFKAVDVAWQGELSRLCRMAKAWRASHNVPMSGLQIDSFAYLLVGDRPYRAILPIAHDHLIRQYFSLLMTQDPNGPKGYSPGSGERIWRRGDFESEARKAYGLAVKAIDLAASEPTTAKAIWREIFGERFPL